jgi:hypothetical protein
MRTGFAHAPALKKSRAIVSCSKRDIVLQKEFGIIECGRVVAGLHPTFGSGCLESRFSGKGRKKWALLLSSDWQQKKGRGGFPRPEFQSRRLRLCLLKLAHRLRCRPARPELRSEESVRELARRGCAAWLPAYVDSGCAGAEPQTEQRWYRQR